MLKTQSIRLGDVVRVKHGFAFSGKEFSDDLSYPTLLTPANFAIGGGFQEAKPKTFLGDFPAEYELKPGDLVITMTDLSKGGDTLGLPALIPDGRTYLHNQRIGLVEIIDPNRVSKPFLAYYLRTPLYRSYILGTASGSTVRHTSPSRIESFNAVLPTLTEQRAIAEVLCALDDKIAANTKVIATADALAQAKFYTALHDSQSQPLSSLASFVNGKAFTKGASGTGRVVVRIAELNSGIGKSTVFSDAEVDDKHVARPGDILFAWSGSLTLHRWYRDEAIVNQHIFKVIPNGATADWMIYELLRNKIEDFKRIAANKATTMGHIQRKHLDEPVLVPTKVAQREIAPLMESLWQTALTAERENLTLAATRDTLLPHLISGKLRVKEAEKVLEDAL